MYVALTSAVTELQHQRNATFYPLSCRYMGAGPNK